MEIYHKNDDLPWFLDIRFKDFKNYVDYYVVYKKDELDKINKESENIEMTLNDPHVRSKSDQKNNKKLGYYAEKAIYDLSKHQGQNVKRYDDNDTWVYDLNINDNNIEVKSANIESKGQNIPLRYKNKYKNYEGSELIEKLLKNNGKIADYLCHTIVDKKHPEIVSVGICGFIDTNKMINTGELIDLRSINCGIYYPIDDLNKNKVSIF